MNPLFAVRDDVSRHQITTAAHIAQRLNLPPAVVESALEHWIRRGQIDSMADEADLSSACATCASPCTAKQTARLYRWRAGSVSNACISIFSQK